MNILRLHTIEDVKGFRLTDLGMDAVDADMVLETLKREFGSSAVRRYIDAVISLSQPPLQLPILFLPSVSALFIFCFYAAFFAISPHLISS